jgi:UPF0755 protein
MLKRLAILFLLLVVAAGAGAWWFHARLVTPYRGFSDAEVFVELPAGSGVPAIAGRLADAGVVPDAWTFRVAAQLSHMDRRLQAGEYRFAAAATPGDVAWRLGHGDVFRRVLKVPEGETIKDIAAAFEKAGLGTAAAFTALASDGSLVAAFDPEARTLEGYLFPATYSLSRHAGADGAVRAMLTSFAEAFDAGLRADAEIRQLGAREVVTIASLVEKETAQPSERPLISAVYQNRLRIGMLLQCDPTVIYALTLAGRWNGNLTRQNLQFDSPYNTYKYPGLPPGPIASPGRASIDAAVHPASVRDLYFVSKGDGTHVFATTLAEHTRNVQRWQIKRR